MFKWLSGRMPDSRAREHRHESSCGLHIGADVGDSLWRCYAMTTQNHCTFVKNRDLFINLFRVCDRLRMDESIPVDVTLFVTVTQLQ